LIQKKQTDKKMSELKVKPINLDTESQIRKRVVGTTKRYVVDRETTLTLMDRSVINNQSDLEDAWITRLRVYLQSVWTKHSTGFAVVNGSINAQKRRFAIELAFAAQRDYREKE
jgi:hypothetical protein